MLLVLVLVLALVLVLVQINLCNRRWRNDGRMEAFILFACEKLSIVYLSTVFLFLAQVLYSCSGGGRGGNSGGGSSAFVVIVAVRRERARRLRPAPSLVDSPLLPSYTTATTSWFCWC